MSVKTIAMPKLGAVLFNKRRNSRSIRISLGHNGQVKVTLPRWVSYFEAQRFVASKTLWILDQKVKVEKKLVEGQQIGKYHNLSFMPLAGYNQPRGFVKEHIITIKFPAGLAIEDQLVQDCALKASNKALMEEAREVLPARLNMLANEHSFKVSDIKIKLLKSRWGSCNSRNEITLNSHLMLLPWHLVDYVLLHELIHTKVMKHGQDFWNEFKNYDSQALALRKEIKTFRSSI
jgi:predicted metal-dependent hydrolase